MTLKFLPIFLVLAIATASFAQGPRTPRGAGPATTPDPNATPAPTNIAMWKCTLPGGTYEVAVRSIVSVSTHEFIVDNAARVTEVNIDTFGNTVARFYYLEPITAQSPLGIGQSGIDKLHELAQEVSSRVGLEEVWKKVSKSYPTSTHAHTVEYRLDSKDEITQLFTSAETAFRLQKNTAFSLAGSAGGQ
jgi:hypothetical protein